MNEHLHTPRTLEYHILRVCERLHLHEDDFHRLSYPQQLRLLAYEQIRQRESRPFVE